MRVYEMSSQFNIIGGEIIVGNGLVESASTDK